MKLYQLALLTVAAAMTACGGGGGASDVPAATPSAGTPPVASPAGTAPTAVASSGSVSAPFIKGVNAKYFWVSVLAQNTGVLTSFKQNAAGAIVDINDSITLTGNNAAAQEISGDANYAQGRWNSGTAKMTVGTETLNPNTIQSIHYIVLNNLASIPTSGTSKSCAAGQMTTPIWIGSRAVNNAPDTGAATATGSISFNSAGANVALVVNAIAGSSNASANFGGIVKTPSSTYTTGDNSNLSTSSTITLGDGGNGAIIVGGHYSIILGNGAVYRGVLSLKCA
jgi:hypothetical protein